MHTEIFFFVIVPLAALGIAGGLAFWFGRLKARIGLGVMAAAWLAFTLAMIFGLQTARGWDGLGYLFGLLFLALPVGLGTFFGGIFGWQRKDESLYA